MGYYCEGWRCYSCSGLIKENAKICEDCREEYRRAYENKISWLWRIGEEWDDAKVKKWQSENQEYVDRLRNQTLEKLMNPVAADLPDEMR